MTTQKVENFAEWLQLKQTITDLGFKLWQTQFNSDSIEGYHARYMNGSAHFMVITHNRDIEMDIRNSGM